MGWTKSPVTPLGAALAIWLCVGSWRGAGLLASALTWYAAFLLWTWWSQLVVSVDGVPYKESFTRAHPRAPAFTSRASGIAARNRELAIGAKDGFHSPRERWQCAEVEGSSASESPPSLPFAAEFAPWAPSMPHGKPAAVPSASAAPKPYWLECDASVFDVRNIRYKQTKEKVPSEFALYDCVGMDMIRDRRRIDRVAERFPSGASCGALPRSPAGAVEWSPSWGVPRVLIASCQLPYKAGWLMGAHPEDDGGLSVCNYFVLSERASEMLAKDQATPALRLWKRFVEDGASTKEGISFKVVGRVEDLDKYEVPESFHRFNNKPVLLTKSCRMVTSRLPEVIEIDYDIRSWVYPARTALANYHHRAAEAELEIGYLVEGKADDELPEQILGCFKMYDMDITQAQWVSIM